MARFSMKRIKSIPLSDLRRTLGTTDSRKTREAIQKEMQRRESSR